MQDSIANAYYNMITEGKIDDLAAQHPDVPVRKYAEMDTSKTKKFLPWLVSQHKKGNLDNVSEDEISDTINNFDKYKSSHKIVDHSRHSFQEIRNAVVPHIGLGATKRDRANEGIEKIFDDGKGTTAYHVKTAEASIAKYGGGVDGGKECGTNWCISASGPNNRFGAYGPTYTIHRPDGSFHAVHPASPLHNIPVITDRENNGERDLEDVVNYDHPEISDAAHAIMKHSLPTRNALDKILGANSEEEFNAAYHENKHISGVRTAAANHEDATPEAINDIAIHGSKTDKLVLARQHPDKIDDESFDSMLKEKSPQINLSLMRNNHNPERLNRLIDQFHETRDHDETHAMGEAINNKTVSRIDMAWQAHHLDTSALKKALSHPLFYPTPIADELHKRGEFGPAELNSIDHHTNPFAMLNLSMKHNVKIDDHIANHMIRNMNDEDFGFMVSNESSENFSDANMDDIHNRIMNTIKGGDFHAIHDAVNGALNNSKYMSSDRLHALLDTNDSFIHQSITKTKGAVEKLNSEHIDKLIDAGHSNTNIIKLENNNKINLTTDQLRKVSNNFKNIELYASHDKAGRTFAKHEDNLTEEEKQKFLTRSPMIKAYSKHTSQEEVDEILKNHSPHPEDALLHPRISPNVFSHILSSHAYITTSTIDSNPNIGPEHAKAFLNVPTNKTTHNYLSSIANMKNISTDNIRKIIGHAQGYEQYHDKDNNLISFPKMAQFERENIANVLHVRHPEKVKSDANIANWVERNRTR